VEAATGAARLIDQGTALFSGASSEFNETYRFSPDGRWVVYSKLERNDRSRVYLYEVPTGRRTPVTRPEVNSFAAAFDASGRYLIYVAERQFDVRRDPGGGTVSFGPRARLTLLPLSAATPTPFAPGAPGASALAPTGAVDLEGIEDRAVDVPVPADDYTGLEVLGPRLLARAGDRTVVFDLARLATVPLPLPSGALPLARGDRLLSVVPEGLVLLEVRGDSLHTLRTARLSDDSIRVDVKAERAQIYREAGRAIRELYYDPSMGGRNWDAVLGSYERQLAAVGDREDLNRLLGDLLAELGTSHAKVGGGDTPAAPAAKYRFLGIDAEPAAGTGGFRITRILRGDGFDLRLRSPLAEPGVGVAEGDYRPRRAHGRRAYPSRRGNAPYHAMGG
jgi:tricorn protease